MIALVLAAHVAATLDLRATTLGEALPKIGEMIGAPMRADGSIAEEIVVARLDRAPLDEVRRRLAEEFAGEWRTDRSGTLVFFASAMDRRRERDEWYRRRRERTGRYLAERRRELAALGEFDLSTVESLARTFDVPEGANPPGHEAPTPERRLLLRVLAELRPEDLNPDPAAGGDAFDPLPFLAFSLTPTRHQRRLGRSAADALIRYREEAALWHSVAPERDLSEGGAKFATRLLLTLSSGERRSELYLTTYDAAGEPVGVCCEDVPQGVFDRETFGRESGDEAPKIPFRFASAATSDVRAFLHREPLAEQVSDVLLSAARLAGRSLIAAPSDALLSCETPRPRDRDPDERVGLSRKEAAEAERDLEGWIDEERGEARFDGLGWMRVRTDEPFFRRAIFWPRASLRREAGSLMRNDPPSLAASFLAARSRPDWPELVPGDSLLLPLLGSRARGNDAIERRLPAALTAGERYAAERGGVPIDALNPRARRFARAALYGNGNSRDRGPSGLGSNWDDEPTNRSELAVLFLDARNRLNVEFRRGGESSLATSYDFLRLLSILENLRAKSVGIDPFDLDRLRFFDRETWDLHLRIGDEIDRAFTIEGAATLSDRGTYSSSTIPPALVRRLRRESEEIRPR